MACLLNFFCVSSIIFIFSLFSSCSEQMNALRTNFEKAGQFFEADQAKQRVTKLRDAINKKKLLNLSERHRGEVAFPSLNCSEFVLFSNRKPNWRRSFKMKSTCSTNSGKKRLRSTTQSQPLWKKAFRTDKMMSCRNTFRASG